MSLGSLGAAGCSAARWPACRAGDGFAALPALAIASSRVSASKVAETAMCLRICIPLLIRRSSPGRAAAPGPRQRPGDAVAPLAWTLEPLLPFATERPASVVDSVRHDG